MARCLYGGTIADFVLTVSGGVFAPATGHSITFWSAAAGGVQYTDLAFDAAGTQPISGGVLTANVDGSIPQFYGPNGIKEMWADAGGPERVLMQAITSSVGYLGNVTVSSSTPSAPAINDLWFDTGNYQWNMWDGTYWQREGSANFAYSVDLAVETSRATTAENSNNQLIAGSIGVVYKTNGAWPTRPSGYGKIQWVGVSPGPIIGGNYALDGVDEWLDTT